MVKKSVKIFLAMFLISATMFVLSMTTKPKTEKALADTGGGIVLDETTIAISETDFFVRSVACRIEDEKTENGVRFKSVITQEKYNEIETNKGTHTVEYGLILIPAYKLTGELTVDTVDVTQQSMNNILCDKVYNEIAYKEGCIYVYDIPDTHKTDDIVVRGYIKVDEEIKYYTATEQVCMAEVCYLELDALNDGTSLLVNAKDLTKDKDYFINYITQNYLTYTATYYNGTESLGTATVIYKTSVGEITEPTKTGYTFTKYYLDSTTQQEYNSSNLSVLNGNLNLYAGFSANTYTVTYHGADGTTTTSNHTYDSPQNLTSNAFTKTGCTFNNWEYSDGTTIKTFTNGEQVENLTAENNGNIDLYSTWKVTTAYAHSGVSTTGGTYTSSKGFIKIIGNRTENNSVFSATVSFTKSLTGAGGIIFRANAPLENAFETSCKYLGATLIPATGKLQIFKVDKVNVDGKEVDGKYVSIKVLDLSELPKTWQTKYNGVTSTTDTIKVTLSVYDYGTYFEIYIDGDCAFTSTSTSTSTSTIDISSFRDKGVGIRASKAGYTFEPNFTENLAGKFTSKANNANGGTKAENVVGIKTGNTVCEYSADITFTKSLGFVAAGIIFRANTSTNTYAFETGKNYLGVTIIAAGGTSTSNSDAGGAIQIVKVTSGTYASFSVKLASLPSAWKTKYDNASTTTKISVNLTIKDYGTYFEVYLDGDFAYSVSDFTKGTVSDFTDSGVGFRATTSGYNFSNFTISYTDQNNG